DATAGKVQVPSAPDIQVFPHNCIQPAATHHVKPTDVNREIPQYGPIPTGGDRHATTSHLADADRCGRRDLESTDPADQAPVELNYCNGVDDPVHFGL